MPHLLTPEVQLVFVGTFLVVLAHSGLTMSSIDVTPGTAASAVRVTSAPSSTTPAPTQPPSIHDLAQSVARKACPYAMLQEYGCPIRLTGGTQQQKEFATSFSSGGDIIGTARRSTDVDEIAAELEGGATKVASSVSAVGPATTAVKASHPTVPQEKHWNPGDVPIGVGFNTATMKIGLPMYYPVGTKTYKFDITVVNKTYSSIEDYAGSIDPQAMKALVTGALDTNTGKVFKTFFGSYSFLHRTTVVDIISDAAFNTTNPEPLPEVAIGLRDLPTPYSAAVAQDYEDFFNYFGTHVVVKAAIGGALESLVSIKSCFASGRATMIQNDAQIEMAKKTLLDPTKTKINQAYVEHRSNFNVSMYGGNPTIFELKDWKRRERSIAEQPVLIKVDEMQPISYFLPAGAQKVAMADAITAYQNKIVNARNAALAKAKSDQTFTVIAATSVAFTNFIGRFNYRKRVCKHKIFGHCFDHKCDGRTACFEPGGCGTGCGSGTTASIVVPDLPTKTLHRSTSATLSPDAGKSSCTCSAGFGGFQQPEFPFLQVKQSVTCSVDAHGRVTASSVTNPQWEQYKTSGSRVQHDGEPVAFGCSVATAEYIGMEYSGSGGNEGCGTSTAALTTSGKMVASGFCCIDTTPVPVWDKGYSNCYGNLDSGSCPGFNKI